MSGESQLGVANIGRCIFQGDWLSPLLFVVAVIPITLELRKIKQGYSFGREKIR